jgi:hypothetical protein
VVFDFLDKLRDLERAGDTNARKKLAEFEKARQTSDVKSSLEFERTIISMAKTEFELISPIEADDLERLLEDRNRCAHPSMLSLENAYNPTPELTRTHIRNAITHSLEHPPVQGKAAFDRIAADIESEYFPANEKEAAEVFKAGPLVRARRPLVRNLNYRTVKAAVESGMD